MQRTKGVTKRPRRRPSRTETAGTEEDGTQCEREEPQRAAKPQPKTYRKKGPVGAAAFKEFVAATVQTGVPGLAAEFVKLRQETQSIGAKPKTAFDANGDKNRYKDVYCIDESRVKLSYPAGCSSDYIHANWVKIDKEKNHYICTQGPTKNTVEDFWRMVWQVKSTSIVMLCNLTELGKPKCEQYWPATKDQTVKYGKLTVTNKGTLELEKNLVETTLELAEETGTPLKVQHIQWRDWPDRGVPEANGAVFRLINKIADRSPVTIHCSAGIGRTGTVVGLDIAYKRMMKGETVRLEDIVRELRSQRHGSVQTDVQYLFMHRQLTMLAENLKYATAEDTAAFALAYDSFAKARS